MLVLYCWKFIRFSFAHTFSFASHLLFQDVVSKAQAFTMVNLQPKRTGLPMVVYVSPKNALHGPRVKVSKRYRKKMAHGEWFLLKIQCYRIILFKVPLILITKCLILLLCFYCLIIIVIV
jgi:hypothetical protein